MFRLLIVEDEENSRKGLKATLAPIPNLEIDTACDGREGYAKAIRISLSAIFTCLSGMDL